jgi:deoxycytidylate deaminase
MAAEDAAVTTSELQPQMPVEPTADVTSEIQAKIELIKDLKANKASKEEIGQVIKELKTLQQKAGIGNPKSNKKAKPILEARQVMAETKDAEANPMGSLILTEDIEADKAKDLIFMGLACMAAQRSEVDKVVGLKVGCAIRASRLNMADNQTPPVVMSVGWNGHDGAEESGVAPFHAEHNAIHYSSYSKCHIASATVYVTHLPCRLCAAELVQARVSRVLFLHSMTDVAGKYAQSINTFRTHDITCAPLLFRTAFLNLYGQTFSSLVPKGDNFVKVMYLSSKDSDLKAAYEQKFDGWQVQTAETDEENDDVGNGEPKVSWNILIVVLPVVLFFIKRMRS